MKRRNFIKKAGLGALPFATGFNIKNQRKSSEQKINFAYDGIFLDPLDYAIKLQEAINTHRMKQDYYGEGGIVAKLEMQFADITGKEKAIYLPTGTMANQLALKLLSGESTKIFVQENSHVFRDESDAAQSVHNKRLIPLYSEESHSITKIELEKTIASLDIGEVFKSGYGATSIESPIRRSDGQYLDISELKSISQFCRNKDIKLHLDGARIYFASLYSNTSIKDIAQYFDTVYISLYKYLGAAGGAILAGDKELISKIPHLIKIHGGSVFQSWPNAAIAYHKLQSINQTLLKSKSSFDLFFAELNSYDGFRVSSINHGTNVYHFELTAKANPEVFVDTLINKHNILIRPPQHGKLKLFMNESILLRDGDEVLAAFKAALNTSIK